MGYFSNALWDLWDTSIENDKWQLTVLSRVYTPCARMRWQPAQMSTLAAACASPLHSASCAVDKSINRRAYASVYGRIRPYQNNASALGDLGALSWLAGMPALVCAGLESSTSLNARARSINPALFIFSILKHHTGLALKVYCGNLKLTNHNKLSSKQQHNW